MLLIEKEVKKMYEAQITALIIFFYWVSNLVPTRNKTGDIRMCVEF